MCTSWCFPRLEALLATCFDGLGVTSPGAPPRDRRNQVRPLCVCVGHLDPTTREWLDVNCGQPTTIKGQVKKWHKPPPGYDHQAIVHDRQSKEAVRRQARVAARPPLAHDPSAELLSDLVFSLLNLDTVELSLNELDAQKARILRERTGVFLTPLARSPPILVRPPRICRSSRRRARQVPPQPGTPDW